MAVMTWFAVDCNLYTHPKLMQFASALKIDPDSAAGKLGRLWAWAKQSGNEDGNINWLPYSEIADIMRWKKKPSVLIDALVECGFLDNLDDGLHIHGWADLNGRLQEKKRKDRERKSHGNSAEIPESIHGNSAPTRPDHTLPTLSSPTVQKECKAAKPPVIELPLNDGTMYPISQEQSQEWAGLYPAVDVIQQLRQMKDWLGANPTRRKTNGGIKRFVTNWLAKEQNKGGSRPSDVCGNHSKRQLNVTRL